VGCVADFAAATLSAAALATSAFVAANRGWQRLAAGGPDLVEENRLLGAVSCAGVSRLRRGLLLADRAHERVGGAGRWGRVRERDDGRGNGGRQGQRASGGDCDHARGLGGRERVQGSAPCQKETLDSSRRARSSVTSDTTIRDLRESAAGIGTRT
jgi:hypothetical protein